MGIGSGISFCNYLTFDREILTNKNVEYDTKKFDIEMKDNLNLAFLEHDKVEIVYDDSLDNIKIEVTYDKDEHIWIEDLIKISISLLSFNMICSN